MKFKAVNECLTTFQLNLIKLWSRTLQSPNDSKVKTPEDKYPMRNPNLRYNFPIIHQTQSPATLTVKFVANK